jgi:hypothetical protein
MAKGFLYVAENPSMDGLIKIGHTVKVPTARLAELFTTGVPEPFEVAYYALVQDSKKTESAVHQLLSRYRPNKNREFFAISISAAIHAIRAIEQPEHEWKNPAKRSLKSSNIGIVGASEHLINLTSRDCDTTEENQLEEFAQAIQYNNLHPFVLAAFYDSNSCCCQFTLTECVGESSHLADEILVIALESISQFEWFGCIYHGRGSDDVEF